MLALPQGRAVKRTALLWLLLLGLAWSQTRPPICKFCSETYNRGYTLQDGTTVCEAHLDQALPKCYSCRLPIKSSHHIVGPEKTPVCRACYANLPRCDVCQLPAGASGIQLRDGRFLCAQHRAVGVFQSARAEELFFQAQAEVVKVFGQSLRLTLPVSNVRLVDNRQMRRLTRDPRGSQTPLGLTRVTTITQGTKKTVQAPIIYLTSGLPPKRLLTVSAHEYAHAWQSQNHDRYDQMSREMQEGFAEWIAYSVARAYGRKAEVQALMTKRDSDYVRGLKKFLALEKAVGREKVFEFALSQVNF